MYMGIEKQLSTPLAEAVRKAKGQSAFGRIVGRNQSTIFDWLNLNKPLPAELVLMVEDATGVSRHVLRPDIFGPAPPVVAAYRAVEGDPTAVLETARA